MTAEWSEHCDYCGWVTEIRPHFGSCAKAVEEIHSSDGVDPCDVSDHYHCDNPSSVEWKADAQTITVTCCCGEAVVSHPPGNVANAASDSRALGALDDTTTAHTHAGETQ